MTSALRRTSERAAASAAAAAEKMTERRPGIAGTSADSWRLTDGRQVSTGRRPPRADRSPRPLRPRHRQGCNRARTATTTTTTMTATPPAGRPPVRSRSVTGIWPPGPGRSSEGRRAHRFLASRLQFWRRGHGDRSRAASLSSSAAVADVVGMMRHGQMDGRAEGGERAAVNEQASFVLMSHAESYREPWVVNSRHSTAGTHQGPD